jgi:methylated-DNA-[protein]-cysteine S-methyltransferase
MGEVAGPNNGSGRGVRSASLFEIDRDYAAVTATPWPDFMLGVTVRGELVSSIDFLDVNIQPYTVRNAMARETVRQLRAYFKDPQHRFSLPLDPRGTAFQLAVWAALRRIPVGETRSYGELAKLLASGPRAVGGACRVNPLAVVIPCHRVVASHGIGGFMGVTKGRGLRLKRHLLAHELHS